MPWCPKCKTEFREGIEICSDCKTELVNKIKEEKIEYDKEIFLMCVAGEIEANGVESLLRAHDIPVLKKHKGAGGYLEIYMGMSKAGIDLFVPENLLEEARDIVEKTSEEIVTEEITIEDDNTSSFEENYQRKRRKRTRIILLFEAIGIIGIVSITIYNLVKLLMK